MKKLFFLTLALTSYIQNYAQGCSDAGVCTVEAFKSGDTTFQSYINIGSTLEFGEDGVTVIAPQLNLNYSFNEHWSLQATLKYWYASHERGNVTGISDPILSVSYSFNNPNQTSLFLGTRIGINNANALGNDGFSLPMAAQSSLGTTDIILGAKTNIGERLKASIGAQIPMIQFNENKHVVDRYINGFDTLNTNDQNRYNYYRYSDLILRLDYNIKFGKSRLTLGLLPIFHLKNDEILYDRNSEDIATVIDGSQGLTLNVPFSLATPVSERLNLILDGGFPIIARQERPDGLTRSLVLYLKLQYLFN